MHSELPSKVVLLLRVMYSAAEKPRIVVIETFLLAPIYSPIQLTQGVPFYLCIFIYLYFIYVF